MPNSLVTPDETNLDTAESHAKFLSNFRLDSLSKLNWPNIVQNDWILPLYLSTLKINSHLSNFKNLKNVKFVANLKAITEYRRISRLELTRHTWLNESERSLGRNLGDYRSMTGKSPKVSVVSEARVQDWTVARRYRCRPVPEGDR